jgi:hypothetical protein
MKSIIFFYVRNTQIQIIILKCDKIISLYKCSKCELQIIEKGNAVIHVTVEKEIEY